MIQAVIFDADHTLYTPASERAYEEKFQFLAEQTGVAVETIQEAWTAELAQVKASMDPDERFRKHRIQETLKAVGSPPDEQLVDAAYRQFYETVVEDLVYDDELPALLAQLRAAGVTVLAVATNEFPEALAMKLDAVVGGTEVFDMIVTPRDTGTMKPSERFYTPILAEHNLDPETVIMVGDSWENDLAPAQQLGMITVLIGGDTGNPDHQINQINELVQIVEDCNES